MENLKDELSNDQLFLEKLIIGISEVSEVSGVPTRQIRYWEEKKYINSMSNQGKTRRYDYTNIKKIILIKELLDEGFTLEASVQKVEKRYETLNSALKKIKK